MSEIVLIAVQLEIKLNLTILDMNLKMKQVRKRVNKKMKYAKNLFGNKHLTEDEEQTINEALFYAVRERFNGNLEINKTNKMRKALKIMKSLDKKPTTSGMCHLSLDDFFDACVERGWEDDLKEIPWLNVS